MAITIGRAGTDITLREPSTYEETDGSVTISGTITTAPGITTAEADHLRWQLEGLLNPGERVVPVTFGTDDSRNGWYAVLGVSIRHMLGATENGSARQYAVSLQRANQYRRPVIEHLLSGALRENDHSITSANSDPILATAGTPVRFQNGTGISQTRSCADGDPLKIGSDHINFYDDRVGVVYDIADYYNGACRIEWQIEANNSGSDYKILTGTQFPDDPTGVTGGLPSVNWPRWRLSNGMVRLYLKNDVASVYTTGNVEHYAAAGWEDTHLQFSLRDNYGSAAATNFTTPVTATILRNDPSVVVVRTYYSSYHYVDWMIRRGSRWVYVTAKSWTDEDWYVLSSTGSATAGTGFVRLTSNDGNGNRPMVACPNSFTSPAGVDVRLSTDDSVFSFGLGCEVDGSSAGAPNDNATQGQEYYAAQTEIVRVAGR